MKCYVLDGTDSITIAKIYDMKQRYIFFIALKSKVYLWDQKIWKFSTFLYQIL